MRYDREIQGEQSCSSYVCIPFSTSTYMVKYSNLGGGGISSSSMYVSIYFLGTEYFFLEAGKLCLRHYFLLGPGAWSMKHIARLEVSRRSKMMIKKCLWLTPLTSTHSKHVKASPVCVCVCVCVREWEGV